MVDVKRLLGSPVSVVLFKGGHLSRVCGVLLEDGRRVVIRERPWQDRIVACAAVQAMLWRSGFPAPAVVVPPTKQGDQAVSVEELVSGGQLSPTSADQAGCFARALAALVGATPRAAEVDNLAPAPAWTAWGHPGGQIWPAPDDRPGDLNTHPTDRWLDDYAAAARDVLAGLDLPTVIGHGDWYAQNLRWVGDQLHVAYDWDSVVAYPEAAIAGLAAAVWPGTGIPGEVATVEESEQFLAAYVHASSRSWTDDEVRAAWAAGLWTRAFDAKKASLVGESPYLALTHEEAAARARRAGL